MSFKFTLSAVLLFTTLLSPNAQNTRSRSRARKPTPPNIPSTVSKDKSNNPAAPNVQDNKPNARSGDETSPIHFLETNFDPSVEKLPSHFAGHDIKTLYNELSTLAAGAKKGEFETTEEFGARLRRENSGTLLGKSEKNGLFAFTLLNAGGEAFYDADQKIMTMAVVLSLASKDVYTPSDKKGLVSQSEGSEETYEGSNAMGGKVQVTRHLGKDYEVALRNYSNFGMTRYVNSRTRSLGYTTDTFANDAILIQIPMDVATAKSVKEHLKVLAIVRLLEPYTFEGTLYDKPTFDRPQEYFLQYYYVNAELLELWAYDDTSGQIYSRKKLN